MLTNDRGSTMRQVAAAAIAGLALTACPGAGGASDLSGGTWLPAGATMDDYIAAFESV